jgi:glycerophosphoryl diester phosphodiesterase
MVKFGGHIEAIREGDFKGTNCYLVPYNEIKALVFEEDAIDKFAQQWNEALVDAEDDFRNARRSVWEHLFGAIECQSPHEARGLHPGNALKIYADNVHPTKAQELLIRLTQIHRAATLNSEALRKLVKKFDKHQNGQLSLELLPTLYTSSLYAGQNMIQDGIGLLRELLEGDPETFTPIIRNDSEVLHERSVEVRFEELDWLRRLVGSLPEQLLPHLVAHRGFHHIKDRNDKRPLENSLGAYETAWSSGIHLCECDIAITKDEKLVLAHDENFIRLALDSNSHLAVRSIGELTFRELISLPLKSGIRPPLLVDVLRSACAISGHSQLVIEIKPGNEAAASALARLLIRHPDLRQAVAMIMSFDVVTMHRLRSDLSVLESDGTSMTTPFGSQSGMYHRVTSFDHFGVMGGAFGSLRRHSSLEGFDTVGLSLSQTNLDQAPREPPSSVPAKPRNVPKMMLLTVADAPKIACGVRVGVSDLSPVSNWLTTSDGTLDGVYLQYEKSMMTPEGAASLRRLSEKHLVGIWTYSGIDPDDYNAFEWLVKECNCTFVNTDLPNHFRKEIFVRSQSNDSGSRIEDKLQG